MESFVQVPVWLVLIGRLGAEGFVHDLFPPLVYPLAWWSPLSSWRRRQEGVLVLPYAGPF